MPGRYAVIGNPIAQSQSPYIHGQFAAACGLVIDYTRIEAPIGGFAAAVDAFRAHGGQGVNVTAPFKLDACAYATERSAAVELAGAANALKFDGSRVQADNFDGLGLVLDVTRNLGYRLQGRRLLVLGAGGAARGLIGPLCGEGPASIVIANRTVERARALASVAAWPAPVRGVGMHELAGMSFDALFDSTSTALSGASAMLPPGMFAGAGLAYDLVYGKGQTDFQRLAERAGVGCVADGLGMLVEQAAESFRWWHAQRPQTGPVIAALRARSGPAGGVQAKERS